MRPVLLLIATLALLGASGCALMSGQKQTQQGKIQLPGERAAPNLALAVPPDEWAGPARR